MRRPAAWTRPLLLRLLRIRGGLSGWRILLRGRIDGLRNLRRSIPIAGRQILIFRRRWRGLGLVRSRDRLRAVGAWRFRLHHAVVTATQDHWPALTTLLLEFCFHLGRDLLLANGRDAADELAFCVATRGHFYSVVGARRHLRLLVVEAGRLLVAIHLGQVSHIVQSEGIVWIEFVGLLEVSARFITLVAVDGGDAAQIQARY